MQRSSCFIVSIGFAVAVWGPWHVRQARSLSSGGWRYARLNAGLSVSWHVKHSSWPFFLRVADPAEV